MNKVTITQAIVDGFKNLMSRSSNISSENEIK